MAEQSAGTDSSVLLDDESLIVEVHVPLTVDAHAADNDDPFPWIDEVIEYLVQLEDEGSLEMWDDGDEWEGHFVFSLADAPEAELLAAARSIAALPGVPSGVFAMVTTSAAEDYGQGTRVEIA